jgi:hypothetical protein
MMTDLVTKSQLSCFVCRIPIPEAQYRSVGRLCKYCIEKLERQPSKSLRLGHGWAVQKRQPVSGI